MPLQNRVTPTGDIIADPARGLMMGNRGGRLHDGARCLGSRRWVSRQWICCRLDFKGRRRAVMAPGSYTELFFLDEATALAAGHRPCFECRRDDACRFAVAWAQATLGQSAPRAPEIDAVLHAERLDERGQKRLHQVRLDDLPPGTMVLIDDMPGPQLVLDAHLLAWSPGGYCQPIVRPLGLDARALTPPGIIATLKCGYRPLLHETARIWV